MPNYYGGPNPVSGMYPPQGATYPGTSVTPNSINQYNPQNNVNNLTNVLVVPVNGREGVDSYPVAMGMTVLLMDYANKKFWLKSNDGLSPKIVEHIFGANIAVPTGETVGPISVAFMLDGATISSSTMISTPAAVEEFNNVSTQISAQVWKGCCETFSIRNTSDIPILVQNANVVFSRPDLAVSR